MAFEQFAAVVRDWQSRLTPAQARMATESLRRQVYISNLPDEIPLDAVLAAIAKCGPAPVPKAESKAPCPFAGEGEIRGVSGIARPSVGAGSSSRARAACTHMESID